MNVHYLVSITVIQIVTHSVATHRHVDECFLLPSELGPDWYKVPRPARPGANSSEISYMHMPCAVTTVFDVGICACTNLMSYLFESMRRSKDAPRVQTKKGSIRKLDAVKHGVEWEGGKPQKTSGSLLINIRTGEIKNCPFRASPRGRKWYLIRAPSDNWIPMVCADGTVYDTIKCTCVHFTTEHKKPEDEEVFVLQEDLANAHKDNIISQSLGISTSDIDFAPSKKTSDIPFYRREDPTRKPNGHNVISRFRGKSDVLVTLDEQSQKTDTGSKSRIFDPASNDGISDVHLNLLNRLRPNPVASSDPMISSFDHDQKRPEKFNKDNSGTPNKANFTHNEAIRKHDTPLPNEQHTNRNENSDILQVIDKINSQIIKLENVGSDDLIYNGNTSIEIQTATGSKDEIRVDQIKDGKEVDLYDEIFYQEECSKKPIPELGPQYFLFYVLDLGFVPYTCHGNSIYDDSVCACMPSPVDTAFDEVKFPQEECTKRPIPEMGAQFFEDFLFGVGYIPFVCHGNKFYDNAACACV